MTPIDILEQIQWDHSWLPSTCEVIDRPEVCYFVSQSSPSRNMVVRFRPSAERISVVIDEISKAYQGASCTFWFYPHIHTEQVAHHLRRVGFTRSYLHHVRVLGVDEYIPVQVDGVVVKQVQNLADVNVFFEVQAKAFGASNDVTEQEKWHFLNTCTGENATCRYFLVFDKQTGEAISQGGLALHPDLKCGLFFAGGTIERYRKRGAYTALVSARIGYARELGFDMVGLFARASTSSPIVERHGFRNCGEMIYWKREQGK